MDREKENSFPPFFTNDSVEYVLLVNFLNELWEVDYQNGIALNVTEIIKPEAVGNLINYPGRIEEFLSNSRDIKKLHFHESVNFPMRIHFNTTNSSIFKNLKKNNKKNEITNIK